MAHTDHHRPITNDTKYYSPCLSMDITLLNGKGSSNMLQFSHRTIAHLKILLLKRKINTRLFPYEIGVLYFSFICALVTAATSSLSLTIAGTVLFRKWYCFDILVHHECSKTLDWRSNNSHWTKFGYYQLHVWNCWARVSYASSMQLTYVNNFSNFYDAARLETLLYEVCSKTFFKIDHLLF